MGERERERGREREREREKMPYFFLEVEDGVRDGALGQVLAHKWRNKENIILKINKSLGLMLEEMISISSKLFFPK